MRGSSGVPNIQGVVRQGAGLQSCTSMSEVTSGEGIEASSSHGTSRLFRSTNITFWQLFMYGCYCLELLLITSLNSSLWPDRILLVFQPGQVHVPYGWFDTISAAAAPERDLHGVINTEASFSNGLAGGGVAADIMWPRDYFVFEWKEIPLLSLFRINVFFFLLS